MGSPLASRYAKAYFELAQETDAIDQWRDELLRAVAALTTGQMGRALANPQLRRRVSSQLDQVLADVHLQTRNLMRLIIERRRHRILSELVEEYDRLAEEASGVVRAEVLVAVPVDEHLETLVEQTLRSRIGQEVEVRVRQDHSILGGMIVRIGDHVIDNSLSTHLQQLRAALA